MRRAGAILGVALLAACKSSSPAPRVDASTDAAETCPLFGRPNAETGLTADQCVPSCTCGGLEFKPPAYSASFIQSLLDDWTLSAPYAPITSDPYAGPMPPTESPDTVCAVLPSADAGATPRPYALATFASTGAALAAGGKVTHFGACGVCSPLADLVVYMRNDDLTAPVRDCGLAAGDAGADVACLMQLGFDQPCAEAWAFDTNHTRQVCLSICLATLTDPYNLPDGALSPCIQCDETESGPVFKAVAGRTRRNSGLPNAICRPCSEVQPLVHDY